MQTGRLRKSLDVPKFYDELKDKFSDGIKSAFSIAKKSDRAVAIEEVRQNILVAYEDLDEIMTGKLMSAFKKLEKEIVRKTILSGEPRIDGRDQDTVRPIFVETGILPKPRSIAFYKGRDASIGSCYSCFTEGCPKTRNFIWRR